MFGSACARLSAPVSQMQLLYRLPETEGRAGGRVPVRSEPMGIHPQPDFCPILRRGKLRPRELRLLLQSHTVSPEKQYRILVEVASWLRLPKVKSQLWGLLPV